MKLFCITLVLLFISSFHPIQSQKLVSNSSVTGVCYAGNKVKRIYIPPPVSFLKKSPAKGGGSVTIYYTGFSSQAQAAMEYAKAILESMLPADTKLTVLASWERISTAGVLANSSTTGYIKGGSIDALDPGVYYPVAVAEKIAGKSLNDDLEGDITLRINNSINWYLGTDGNTPDLRYDLVTVALHEICHGLGFFDSMNTDNTIGWYGLDSIPLVYDTFVEDLTGNKLTDTLKYNNYSAALLTQFTGGILYFNGPLLRTYTSGSRASLYAPSKYDAGSSIAHLNEEPVTLQENALMTPFIDRGEAIHNPGDYTFSILGDLGWINTRIIHSPPGDKEEHLTNVTLTVTIKSDTVFNRDKVGVVYSFDKFVSEDTVYLVSPGSDNSFSTSIVIPGYNSELKYYFFTEDSFLRLYRSPSLRDSTYSMFIGIDTVSPVITHTPQSFYLETIDSIEFVVTAKDNLGLDSVYIEYKLNNGSSQYLTLKDSGSDTFRIGLKTGNGFLTGIDSIQYRIFGVDSALVPNTTVIPLTGFFVSKIEHLKSVLTSYSTNFTVVESDFLNDGFVIEKPADWSKFGLHSKHPYESPEDNARSISYISLLRHPLKFSESGMLFNFNEVVLVEPGETGSVFGSPGFFDYVILEGSKDLGKSWFSLADGYNSTLVSAWLTGYNSSIVEQNSTFVGTESMLVKHTLYCRPGDKISAGDTLLVRFRLYSDPYANGWGWVIEDLAINPLIDAVENLSTSRVTVYPNPGNGLIKLIPDNEGTSVGRPVRYSVFNSSGTRIKNDYISISSEAVIDISNNPSGLYIIILYRDDGITTIKYSLIK